MFTPWFDMTPMLRAYTQQLQTVSNLNTVLGHRMPLLYRMATDPVAACNPLHWLEVNRMISEKFIAFGQAQLILAASLAQLPFGKKPSLDALLRVQEKALRPISTTLSANANRIGKPKSRTRRSR